MNSAPHKLTLAYSPDTDDAFMVHALKEGLIDTEGLQFEFIRADIQELNERARRGEFDITAISVAAFPDLVEEYALMPVGASVGDAFGPAIVVAADSPLQSIGDLADKVIAVPGLQTTAHFAARAVLPAFHAKPTYFLEIPAAVKSGSAAAGILIHELQLDASPSGMRKIADLGSLWFDKFSLPLPLGANAVHRRLGPTLMSQVNRLYRSSIEYGLEHRQTTLRAASASAAAGLDDLEQGNRYIEMYVNHNSLAFADDTVAAMEQLYAVGSAHGLCAPLTRQDFLSLELH